MSETQEIQQGNEKVETGIPENSFYDHVAIAKKEKELSENQNDKSNSESQQKEKEPWKVEKKQTPDWAKKRFREYSQTVRELRAQNDELSKSIRDLIDSQKQPEKKDLKRDDYQDDESFLRDVASKEAERISNQKLQEIDDRNKRLNEIEKINSIESQNVLNAKTDLPDYDDVVSSGDPDVTLPLDIVRHLAVSPAGAYVKYRLAQDEELCDAIKQAKTKKEKYDIISSIHDQILDKLIERSRKTESKTANVAEEKIQERTKPNHSAPPKVRGSATITNLMSLSGDDYIRARNEQRRNRK